MSRRKISDDELVSVLLQSRTQREAARVLGLSENTISKRMRDNSFKKKLSERRRKIFDEVNSQLTAEAAGVLRELLESTNETIRYSTASRILSLTESYLTATEIMSRLEALEQQYEN